MRLHVTTWTRIRREGGSFRFFEDLDNHDQDHIDCVRRHKFKERDGSIEQLKYSRHVQNKRISQGRTAQNRAELTRWLFFILFPPRTEREKS